MYRQGDILIVKATKLPEKITPRKSRVILEGEVTGHKHQLEGGLIFDSPQGVFLSLESPTNLNHEEHDTITLPEGLYQVIRQREYDENEIRQVAD